MDKRGLLRPASRYLELKIWLTTILYACIQKLWHMYCTVNVHVMVINVCGEAVLERFDLVTVDSVRLYILFLLLL